MAATEQNAALIQVLNGILAQWTAPDFTTAVAAREGVVLDPGALTLLTILNNSGAQRPSALAERMVTGASNISKITARLQQAGLVGRSGDPMDSRASLIVLTQAGQWAGEALQRSGNSLIDELLEDWNAEDRSDMVRLLTRFEVESNRVAATLRDAHGPPTCS
ncbi:MarR family transcriptional regulator [Paenarthrobacter sp. PH39-S1]|uniref:MarR family winged helix-turn-helix transcriptional regulator n=1 Tax=Paenarthrobacter sp. PH39-S1 TaxID=3046204 RepID=UPI0024BBDA5A|nr:MarR family transcriptional regulator [Paenarthrobacter sp. PH39-S1]MDJ0357124.1 MarR family transcriptional regulator [Paenarthrobacter sp. PH39-S1]